MHRGLKRKSGNSFFFRALKIIVVNRRHLFSLCPHHAALFEFGFLSLPFGFDKGKSFHSSLLFLFTFKDEYFFRNKLCGYENSRAF